MSTFRLYFLPVLSLSLWCLFPPPRHGAVAQLSTPRDAKRTAQQASFSLARFPFSLSIFR